MTIRLRGLHYELPDPLADRQPSLICSRLRAFALERRHFALKAAD